MSYYTNWFIESRNQLLYWQ